MSSNNKNNKQILGHVLACLTQMMWGSTFVNTKVLLRHFAPVEILFMRVVLAIIILFIVYPKRLRVKPKKRELLFAGAGFTGIVMYFMLENTALSITYASVVGIIVACAPFFVAVIVGLVFKAEKLRPSFFLGFAISMAGIMMISLNGQSVMGLKPLGVILALFAMVSWGFYSAFVKKLGEFNYNIIAVTRRIYCYAAVFLIPVLIQQKATFSFSEFRYPEVWGNILFLGICGSALGFMLWNYSTKLIGAIKTSVYIYLSPVVTLFMSVLILKERLTGPGIAGTCLIFVGLIIAQNIRVRKNS